MPLVANTTTIEPSNTHERADRKEKMHGDAENSVSFCRERNPTVQLSDWGATVNRHAPAHHPLDARYYSVCG
jgi:hypothetical protein